MGLSDYLIYRVAKHWPSPLAKMNQELNAPLGSDEYHLAYAQLQFDWKVRNGMQRSVTGLDVLEIGSGQGGIACYLAVVGAKSVVGVDLNTYHLQIARQFAERVSARFSPDYHLPVEFLEMSADRMAFAEGQFDLVLADNVFEHFTDPEGVMRECFRVLRPGGGVLVPVFSSIYSKYGLHMKEGLKLPWLNLLFSERTVIRALRRMCADHPELLEVYPGINGDPQRARDVRRYGDLNDITFSKFKQMAGRVGFRVEGFHPFGTRLGRIAARVPGVKNSLLADILSTGAAAFLRKPSARAAAPAVQFVEAVCT